MCGLRQQVHVVPLDAEVHQPKAEALAACSQRATHLDEQIVLTQRRQASPNAQRDMQRMPLRMRRPPRVRDARPPPVWLSTRPHTCRPTCENGMHTARAPA